MGTLTKNLERSGALIEVYIGVGDTRADRLRKASEPVPLVQPVVAMIDTGANLTHIEVEILRNALALPPTGALRVLSTAGADTRETFAVTFQFIAPRIVRMPGDFMVIGSDFSRHEYKGLIGRDILDHCVFTYDGPRRSFVLELPE